MRRPNGSGSISKLSGKRRNKYVVRKTVGTEVDHEKGKVKFKQAIIGYAPTKKAAEELLASYIESPYDLESAKLTFKEIYRRTYESKVGTVSDSSLEAYEYAFKLCEPLHNRPFSELRLTDLQNLVDNCGKNFPTLRKIDVILSLMYDYGMKYDIVGKDYSQYVDYAKHKAIYVGKQEEEKHMTHDEVKTMWKRKDDEFCQSVLILMWTGLRVGEFLQLKKEDVHLDEHYFVIPKGKTVNATRKVPIADVIMPFFERLYNDGDYMYLYHTQSSDPEKSVPYDTYLTTFKTLMKSMGWNYTPHAARHTFSSLLADLKVNDIIRSTLMGHSKGNITNTVYTHLDMSVLLEEVNKLECFI